MRIIIVIIVLIVVVFRVFREVGLIFNVLYVREVGV